MSFWTLSLSDRNGANPDERRLEAWDITGLSWTSRNLGQDEMTLTQAVRSMAGDSPWPSLKRARVYLRDEDPAESGVFLPGSGRKFFDGVIMNESPSNGGTAKSRTVKILGPWWYFKLPYLQPWKDGASLVYANTHVMLFADPDSDQPGHGQLLTAAQQLEAIVRYYAEMGAPIALDTSTAPWEPAGLYLPIMPGRDMTGETAIRACLEKAPQVCIRWDYEAETPACRFVDPSSAAELARSPAVTLDPGAYVITQQGLTRRSDLVCSAVQINYEVVNTIDGVTRITPLDPGNGTVDIYPAAAWDGALKRMKDSYLLEGGFVQTVDLQGSQVTLLSGQMVCQAHNLASKAWWQSVKPDLSNPSLTSWDFNPESAAPVVAVNMDTGEPISLAALAANYPYRVVDGQFATWMRTSSLAGDAVRVRVVLNYAYEMANTKKGQEFVNVEFTACNLPGGTYVSASSVVAAEPIPAGLAEYFYRVMSVERYEGSLEIAERELSQALRAGDVVNLAGGQADWLAMNAVVQEASYDLATRKTSVKLGLPAYLGVRERCDLARLFRLRRVWMNPAAQKDPTKVGSSGSVTFPSRATSTAESGPVAGTMSLLRLGTDEDYVKHDGENSALTVYKTTDNKTVEVKCADLPSGGVAKFRAINVCVKTSDNPETWANRVMYVLGTEPA